MNKKLVYFAILLTVLMAVDFLTTNYAISHKYGYEGNGLMAVVVSSPIVFFLVKVLGTGIIIYNLGHIMRKNEKAAVYGMKTILFLMLIVVTNNVYVISANATTLFDEPYWFSGQASSQDGGGGGGSATGYTTNVEIASLYINADQIKILDRYRILSLWNGGGSWCNGNSAWPAAYIKVDAGGVLSYYKSFDAYIGGTYYGSGVIGWYKTGVSGSTSIYYDINFDVSTINRNLANGLTGAKRMDLVYDRSVFTYGSWNVGQTYCSDPANGNRPNALGGSQITSPNYAGINVNVTMSQWNGALTYNIRMIGQTYIEYQYEGEARVVFKNISSEYGTLNFTQNNVNYNKNITSNGTVVHDITSATNLSVLVKYDAGLSFKLTHIPSGVTVTRTISTAGQGGSGNTDSSGQINVESPVYVGTVPVIGYSIANYDSHNVYFLHLVWPDTENSYWEDSISGASGTDTWSCCTWNHIGVWQVQLWSWNRDYEDPAGWVKLATQNVSAIGAYAGLDGYFSYPSRDTVFNASGPWTFKVNVSQATTHYTLQIYAPDTWYKGDAPIEESAPTLGNSTFINTVIDTPIPGPYWAQIYDYDNGLFVNYTLFYVNGFNATSGYNNTFLSCSCGTSLEYDLLQSMTLFYSSNGTGLLKVKDPENVAIFTSSVQTGYSSKIINLGTALKNNKLGNYVITLTDANGVTVTKTVRVFRAGVNFADGWYLSTNKKTYGIGEVVSVDYKMPESAASGLMVLQDSEAKTVFSGYVPSGGGTTSIVLPSSGYAWGHWYLMLKDTNGTINAVNVLSVNRTDDGSGDRNDPGQGTNDPIAASQAFGDNLWYFISLPMFWGLVIWILAIAAVATGKQGEDRSKSIELVAVIGAALEAVVGLWAPYTWFVVAILIIALGSKFYASRKVSQGGE